MCESKTTKEKLVLEICYSRAITVNIWQIVIFGLDWDFKSKLYKLYEFRLAEFDSISFIENWIVLF